MAIQVIVNQAGPLPITTTFNALTDEPMYLEVNGSVWCEYAGSMIKIGIDLDGQNVGSAQIYSGGGTAHRTVVPAYIPIQLGQGQHTLNLYTSSDEARSDDNDFYTAVIHY
jgi:hypothetical protein